MRQPQRNHRGVSLIEALVALAVMAFGMLGIVGVQSTLRLYSDISKQRSEAVRLGQRMVEDARTFSEVTATAGVYDYSDLVGVTQPVAGYVSNTTYTLVRQVGASGDLGNSEAPRLKTVRVTVEWADRTAPAASTNQSVVLNTAVARITPELSGTLSLAANIDATGVPKGGPSSRHRSIPKDAVNFGNGSSGYIPPNRPVGNTTAWLFSNVTGVISLCESAVVSNAVLTVNDIVVANCVGKAWLLSGYVSFASNDTVAQALAPTGVALGTAVYVKQSLPAARVVGCFSPLPTAASPYVFYACAVPVDFPVPATWSGMSYVYLGTPAVPTVAPTSICRFTSTRAELPAPAPAKPNIEHPESYAAVNGPLTQQNFLVIPAGNCPINLSTSTTTVSAPYPAP